MKNKNKISQKDSWFIILTRFVLGSLFILAGAERFFLDLPFSIVPESDMEALRGISIYTPMLLKFSQLILGTFLIFNYFVPLTLILLTPIIVNISLYALVENAQTIPMALIVSVCTIALYVYYRKVFYVFLKPQMYSQPWRDETSNLLILEEVEEKAPEKVSQVKKLIKHVQSI